MSGGRVSGDISWGAPCGCGGGDAAAVNPAAVPSVADAKKLIDGLGQSLALASLAERLGVPGGAQLGQDVVAFIASAPGLGDIGGPVEVGGWLSMGAKLTGGAAKTFRAVEARAVSAFAALRKSPGLILSAGVVGVGALAVSQFFGGEAAAKLAQVQSQEAVVKEGLARLSPEAVAKFLESSSFLASPTGGVSLWLVGGGLLAALLLWRVLR
jgi:hypothetical protein